MNIYSILWPIHAVLMGLSFLAMLTGMFISRYGKGKKWWLKTHRGLGTGGGIGAVIALVIATIMVSVSHGYHLSSPHSIIGLITIVLIILTPLIGSRMLKPKASGKKVLRVVHRWIGRVTLVMMAATILFGLRIAGIIYF